jgi:hypothetical protein
MSADSLKATGCDEREIIKKNQVQWAPRPAVASLSGGEAQK